MRLKAALIAMCVGCVGLGAAPVAKAARGDGRTETRQTASPQRQTPMATAGQRARARQTSTRRTIAGNFSGGISCVPYARSVTGMEISGNGREWWYNAAGRYARGQRPEPGSILSFPSSGSMGSGHVAVVSRVNSARAIEIDHANWGGPGIRRGTVMRNVRVIDVSDDNSWTRVRVQVGWDSDTFGREYPTHGFIHNRSTSTYATNDDMIRQVSYTQRREVSRPARRAAPRPAARLAASNNPSRR